MNPETLGRYLLACALLMIALNAAAQSVTVNFEAFPAQDPLAVNTPPRTIILAPGQTATIRWTSSGVSAVRLCTFPPGPASFCDYNLAVPVALNGSMQISPMRSTGYSFLCSVPSGSCSTSTVQAFVTEPGPPHIDDFRAFPPNPLVGSQVSFFIAGGNATRVSIDNGVGGQILPGWDSSGVLSGFKVTEATPHALTAFPLTRTTYTATAVNPAGSVTRQVTIAPPHSREDDRFVYRDTCIDSSG